MFSCFALLCSALLWGSVFGCIENMIRAIPDNDTDIMDDTLDDTGGLFDDTAIDDLEPSVEEDTSSQTGGNGGNGGNGGSTNDSGSNDTHVNEPTAEPDSTPPEPIEEAGDSRNFPMPVYVGAVIVNELMIDPSHTQDKYGEWVELFNITNYWIDLRGARLQDYGVDDYAIDEVTAGSLVVAPNSYVVICADTDFWNNGGVNCQGHFLYQSFGGGFSLSNADDEVILRSATGAVIDMFAYVNNFAVVGASLGLKPSAANMYSNDNASNWCDQWGFLPQGDYGNPGQMNDSCW